MTTLEDMQTNINNLKLVGRTQVDLSYFNSIYPLVFSNPTVLPLCSAIQMDIQFINQMGNQLFNYYTDPDPSSRNIWYVALASELTQAMTDSNNLIAQIPQDNSKGPQLATVLNAFIADSEAIQQIIPQEESS